ncbi:MAG: sugar phosphate isomerase/epimerase family protein [Candidatus Latescibacterota bacterium]
MTKMTRRRAIAGMTATTGLLAGCAAQGGVHSQIRDGSLFETSPGNPPFLSPWSPPSGLKKDLAPGPTAIRLSCSAFPFNYPKNGAITDMVKRVRDNGYTSAGCGDGAQWLKAPESEIRELAAALAKYDVTFFDMHAAVNNIHPDPAERKRINGFTIRQMEAAERVGCPLVTTHVGSCADHATHAHPDNWTWATWKLSISSMRQILKDTEGMKVALAIEPNDVVQVNTPLACRHLVDEVGPRLKICMDPVNMSGLANHFRKTEFIEECFDLVGEDIIVCHAKDIVLEGGLHPNFVQAEPGKGTMDYETYLVRMSRLAWPRTLFLEHLAAERYPDVKAFIEGTAARLGVKIYK